MSRIQKAFAAQVQQLGPRQVRVICTTGAVDRTGEQVVQNGIDLTGFMANPMILWQHNPEFPVGSASEILRTADGISMLIDFAPEKITKKADEVCGLVKADVVRTVSIGFDPIETEPMDPRMAGKKNAPQRYLKCDLMEVSFVSIPANKEAVVTQRQHKSALAETWTVGAAKDLEIDAEANWNGREAGERILDDAGFNGDDPDPNKAKKGFLVYDAASATLKGSYKLPFADIQKGNLVAVASGIRAAASRLTQTDVPDDVQAEARKVIEIYEAQMKTEDDGKKGVVAGRTKAMKTKRGGALVIKDLSDIGTLAWLLDYLGWAQTGARVETALEGDNSKVPEMLAGVMQDLGAALIAMTVEEVAEALAAAQGSLGQDVDANTDDMDEDDAADVLAGKTPLVRRFRAAFYRTKAAASRTKEGRKISADTAKKLKDMQEHHKSAMAHHRSAMKEHTKGMNMCADMLDGADADDGAVDVEDDEIQDGGTSAAKSRAWRLRQAANLRVA